MSVNVLVHGAGTIGKRVAWAVAQQEDMQLYGLANRSLNAHIRGMCGLYGPLAGTTLYCSTADTLTEMQTAAGDTFSVGGTLEDALASGEIDVVVDATPAGIEQQYMSLYKKYGVKSIFQGGADASVAPVSFNANVNYEQAVNAEAARVVSCNTTSLARTTNALYNIGIEKMFVTLVRRTVDPADASKGPVDAMVPVTDIPSHHGPDVQAVMPDVDITTLATKVPATRNHSHYVVAELTQEVTAEDVLDAFKEANRVTVLYAAQGFDSTAAVAEYFRDIQRPSGDMYEAVVWGDAIEVKDGTAFWIHAVHSEAIVVPENVDAIRAVTGTEKKAASVQKTNASLGVL